MGDNTNGRKCCWRKKSAETKYITLMDLQLKLNDDKNNILSSKSRSNVSFSSTFENMILEFDQTLKFPTL
jgi:hypothetical protein